MMFRLLVLLVLPSLLAAPALGEETDQDSPADDQDSPTEEADVIGDSPESVEDEEEQVDPMTARLIEEVSRYYSGVGVSAEDEQVERGLSSLQYMLLDGVSMTRISAAIDDAIRLSSPGRAVPFEIAVPLRLRPDTATEPLPTMGGDDVGPPIAPPDPEMKKRRAERNRIAKERLNRQRLFQQWRKRTTTKSLLLGVGIPLLAASYGIGFGIAGGLTAAGEIPQSWAWVTSVPLAGTVLLSIWTEGSFPFLVPLSLNQVAGTVLIVAGILTRHEMPYDKDPTALRLGTKRDGSPAAVVWLRPGWTGAWIEGRF